MIIIKTKHFPLGKYIAINICGVLFTKVDLKPIDLNHEKIHTKQILEMGIIGFYLWYAIEYIIVRFFHKYQNSSYHDVSFEEEAHNNDKNLEYLKSRKHYAWVKYIKIRSYKKE